MCGFLLINHKYVLYLLFACIINFFLQEWIEGEAQGGSVPLPKFEASYK